MSVVIPTYHRPHLLERCLQALFAQTCDPAAYEIIVVDDCPREEATRLLVERLQRQPLPVTLLPLEEPLHQVVAAGPLLAPRPANWFPVVTARPILRYLPAIHTNGPAAARNLGWRAAGGEIIAFTDDDCLPAPDWLERGLAAFSAETAGVSGQVIVPLPPRPTDSQRNTAGLEHSLFVTANCFYRKSVLEMAGGFDEHFPQAWREDSDLFFTLSERGARLVQAPAAVVEHPPRPEQWGSSLRQQRKSIYNALLYKKHPALYRRHIQKSPPWRYYAMLVSLAALVIGLVSSAPVLALAGAAGWLGLYAGFVTRRLRGASLSAGHVLEMLVTSALIPVLSIYWRLRGAVRYRVWFM